MKLKTTVISNVAIEDVGDLILSLDAKEFRELFNYVAVNRTKEWVGEISRQFSPIFEDDHCKMFMEFAKLITHKRVEAEMQREKEK